MRVTVNKVNEALGKAGIKARLHRGTGYWFFFGGDSGKWYMTGVYVQNISELSVEQWVEEAVRLAAYQRQIDEIMEV